MKWKKVLYVDQGVPDNYVDESFLDEMKKNIHVRKYDFWTVVVASGNVSQQLSAVTFFVAIFILLQEYEAATSCYVVLSSCVLFGLLGYVIYSCLSEDRHHWAALKHVLVFTSFGCGFSPVLQTLTATISTDTVQFMITCMLAGNMLFHDYGAEAAVVSQSLSLNTAIFAAVCMASRLPTVLHSFTMVTLAVLMFAMWPELRRRLRVCSTRTQVPLTLLSVCTGLAAIATVSTIGAVLFTTAQIFITFMCPVILVRMQVYKNNIHGPWDEATIKTE